MSENRTKHRGFATNAIHMGKPEEWSSMPIYMAATGAAGYARDWNATIDALEKLMAALEGGERGLAAACGMSAISQTLMTLLKSGEHILCHRCVYKHTDIFLRQQASKFGIDSAFLDLRDLDEVRATLAKRPRIVFFESLANPCLDIIDIKAVAEIAHEAGALVVVDNTFATPHLLQPLSLGADIVIHSATKYLCGHGDSLGGIVVAGEQIIAQLQAGRELYGGVMSPFNAFLILRGIRTLHIRMDRHCANARAVAEFLEAHKKVASVRYAGLPSHPDHRVAASQMSGFGGMIGFQLKGGPPACERLGNALELCRPWVSLGDVETLVDPYWPRYCEGIPDGYVRVSVGLEKLEDIIADFEQALSRI